MGITDMFGDKADFTKISDDTLYIGDAKQKTKIELDEYGTKAAAVTKMLLCGSAMIDRIISVELDRPYAFLIYDPEEKQVLFMGKVNDPEIRE